MIVCDRCKDLSKPANQCFVAILKEEEKKGRVNEREVKRLPLHLCENCLTASIGYFGHAIRDIGTPARASLAINAEAS